MKKIFLVCYSLITVIFVSNAQNFEGILKYDLKYEGEAISQFASMMPNGYSLKMKGDKSRFSINGGMMSSFMGDVISDGKAQLSYILMPQQKTAYKVSTKDDAAKNALKPTVTNTGIVETVKGYKCTKYKVVMNAEGNEMISYMWTTKDINIKMPASAAKQSALQIYEGIEGFPVKIEQNINQMGMSFMLTVTLSEAKEIAIAESDFNLPSDYKVQEGMPDFGGMMGK